MRGKTDREMCVSNIRIAFSTLLMLEAGRPAKAVGVHCFNAVTTKGTIAGRSLMRVAQLLSMAESRSTFLKGMSVHRQRKTSHNTHWLEYSIVMTPSKSFCPSLSSFGTEMNGWSAGQNERFGSFLL